MKKLLNGGDYLCLLLYLANVVQVNNYEIVVNFFHISHNLT